MIDFEAVNQAAIDRLPDLLPELLPEGHFHGREFRCGDLAGSPGQSLSVNTDTGVWSDFATGDKGGDPVSLVAAVRGLSQVEAARWLGGVDTAKTTTRPTTKRTPDAWKTVPADTPPKAINHDKHGRPSATWEYRGPTGELLGFACRFDAVGEKKQVLPYTHGMDTTTGETGWKWKTFSEPRPLYGLDRLAQRPEAPALIVEGEKTADAAQRLLPAVVAITWPGGCNAVAMADFSALHGRRVAIWPDHDEPGRKAGEAAARAALEAGAVEVFFISPPDKAEGWDLADAEAEGWTPEQVAGWSKGHKQPVKQVGATPVGEEWPEPSPLIVHRQADPYPLEALPGTIGAAVREVVDFVQCPVALGACSALAVVSTVAQGLVDVRRADKLDGPTSLFLLAIADSGERKTTVDGFFSKPVAQWEAEQAEAAKPDLKGYEAGKET